MPRGRAAAMALAMLGCFTLVLVSWDSSALAEPDEPESVPEREITTTDTPKKPAQQVPADIIEKMLEEERAREEQASITSSGTDFDAEEIERAEKALLPPKKTPSPLAEDTPDIPEKAERDEPETSPEQADNMVAPSVAPSLPRRKPRKPAVRATNRKKADERVKLPPGSDRQKHLCRALQSCRNDFIRCKSKIKHPDQSPQWSVEKEACGAIYKKCVEKDFRSGEWFFTRWFYFQELNCK